MLSKIFLLVSLFSLCLYLYGIITTITLTEENNCKMTYMFEYPQFVKIYFNENKRYPKYNLYAYSEGQLIERTRLMQFDGAPVLFIPGNSGSHRQVRSLASVALRKGLENEYTQHLDYFTVDLNSELSGLFGGVLQEQTEFVEHCVKKILNLYSRLPSPPKSIVVIGHSMGGKIAQALLTSTNTSDLINTLITLSTPVDKPVIALDFHYESFYRKIENIWSKKREIINEITNTTNYCTHQNTQITLNSDYKNNQNYEKKLNLNNKLMITIGGGIRDFLVTSGLTDSKYSDIHSMTTSIPNVWLSTDHLCSVWCLELVLVINRFLYSILAPLTTRDSYLNGQKFIEDKSVRLNKANYFFKSQKLKPRQHEIDMWLNKELGDWIEDSRRIYTERFNSGINKTRVQMIRLVDAPQHKILHVEAINMETDDWIFGCAAYESNSFMRYCSKALSLTHFIEKLPSRRHDRILLNLDLHNIKKKYPKWTHILLRMLPTKDPFQINVDIHSQSDREIILTMPKWYSFSNIPLVEDTILGSSEYNVIVKGMEESHQAIELSIKPISCSAKYYHSVGKICVPWTNGFERYHYFTEEKGNPMYLYVPKTKPVGYNSTINPIKVKLILDPKCRYKISAKNSLSMTMSLIVRQFSLWIPAHLVAIILLAFKYQISLSPVNEKFKCGSLHSALIKCAPFFIITASRLFVKAILWTKMLPTPDQYDHPIIVSIIIHGSCLALLTLSTGILWMGICFFGNFAHTILLKLINLPIPTASAFVTLAIQRFPITIGVLLISMALASCGEIALICACLVYFILLTKMYEDYLEEFVFKTAKLISEKLFGKKSETPTTDEEEKLEEEQKSDENEKLLEENVETVTDEISTEIVKVDKVEKEDSENVGKEVVESEDKSDDNDEEVTEEDLDKLLKETLEKQKKIQEDQKIELAAARIEYDAIHDGLSSINFHLPLFFLLFILTVINLPSVIIWAQNYSYSPILNPDPSLIPAVVSLIALTIIWQLKTPKNVSSYKIISSVAYMSAAICVLYCQDSVYRLNAVISTVFLFIALHQLIAPEATITIIENPVEKEIKERVEKIRNLMNSE